MDGLQELLSSARQSGVMLWVDGGELRYRAPKGALSAAQLEALRRSRDHIIELLQNAALVSPQTQWTPEEARHAPLSFSQLRHWQFFQLETQPAVRHIASGTRLTGPVDLGLLQACLAEMVRRHEALRTQIVLRGEEPVQEVHDATGVVFDRVDLSATPAHQHQELIRQHFEQMILRPIDVSRDPLFESRLLRLGQDEHVLIVVMEHIISDAVSRSVLLRDTLSAYAQLRAGDPLRLPVVRTQMAGYARRQWRAVQSWRETRGSAGVAGAGVARLRFPADKPAGGDAVAGWDAVPVRIVPRLRQALASWSRVHHSTLPMTAFAAFAALVLRWCEALDSVFCFQQDGRSDPRLQDAIGYFASVLYVPATLGPSDSFLDFLVTMMREYGGAHERPDLSYIAAQTPRPEFTRNAGFNWIPEGSAGQGDRQDECGLCVTPLPLQRPMPRHLEWDNEPTLVLYDGGKQVTGSLYFVPRRHTRSSMELFGATYIAFLENLLTNPQARIADLPVSPR